MFRIVVTLLLTFSFEVLALDCYTPNGTSRNAMLGYPEVALYAPCNAGAKHSMCCRIGGYNGPGKDSCTHDNMFCANGDLIWRESCTDKTWQDPACKRLFVNGTGYPGAGTSYVDGDIVTDVLITICDDGVSYCYGYNNRACCQAKQGVYLDSSGGQRATNPNTITSATSATSVTSSSISTTSTSSSMSTSSTSSPTSTASSNTSGLSTGAKAGIGAGVAVAVLAAIVIGVFLFMRRKKKRTRTTAQANPQFLGNPVPDAPRYEAPGHSAAAGKYGRDAYSGRAELEGTGGHSEHKINYSSA